MESKDTYTLQELFESLPVTIVQLSKDSGINEVTLARMRDGAKTRRDTVNKLLIALSKVYGVNLNIRNVTGINVMVNHRLEKKRAQQEKEKSVA